LNRIDFIETREEITTSYAPGTLRTVQQHDGSILRLRKLGEGYDPSDKIAAMKRVQEGLAAGEVVTGLLYVDPSPKDLHHNLNTVEAPLNTLDTPDLCSGPSALASTPGCARAFSRQIYLTVRSGPQGRIRRVGNADMLVRMLRDTTLRAAPQHEVFAEDRTLAIPFVAKRTPKRFQADALTLPRAIVNFPGNRWEDTAMISRLHSAVASLVVSLILAPGPASAQRLDEQVAAIAAGITAKAVTVVASRLPVDALIVEAIKRISEREYQFATLFALPAMTDELDCSGVRSCDGDRSTLQKIDANRDDTRDFSAWQQLMVKEGAKYFSQPETIDGFWKTKKKLIVDTIDGLAPEQRARTIKALDATLYAMTLYVSDRDGIQQAFMDRKAAYDLWNKERGLRARTLREAQDRLADRMKKLEIDADKLNLADKVWTAGGEPLLAAVLKVGNDLRQEVNSRSARTQ
jgi:hypothetical protein